MRPYHKASSCPSKPDTCDWDNKNSEDPNPHTLFGAVVSGPNMIDEFEDDRSDYKHSTVGLTHNAGLSDFEIEKIIIENFRFYGTHSRNLQSRARWCDY